ncbi:hypothetical protein [Streptomyces kronopolitis]|uniref:hypothetical protein n=1 Tax=Streptomyces kronopolitis TaxID=1612435 RepID=UPI003D96460E
MQKVTEYQRPGYTIIGNHLTQHRALSGLAIGLAAHIQSLPDGAPVDIRTLARRFPEGRDRIAAALRELETHGYLERVRRRTEGGQLVTVTLSYNNPEATRARRARGEAEEDKRRRATAPPPRRPTGPPPHRFPRRPRSLPAHRRHRSYRRRRPPRPYEQPRPRHSHHSNRHHSRHHPAPGSPAPAPPRTAPRPVTSWPGCAVTIPGCCSPPGTSTASHRLPPSGWHAGRPRTPYATPWSATCRRLSTTRPPCSPTG